MAVFNYKNQTDKFYFFAFWKDDEPRALSVLKPDDVILAVNKAYDDMTPRTISGLGLSESKLSKKEKKNEEYSNLKKKKKELLDALRMSLAKKIIDEVFKKSKFDDNIHQDLCEFFQNEFSDVITELNTDICNINQQIKKIERIDGSKNTYGKAQKIVNMTMKYLYFFDDAIVYNGSVFTNCHMAIDEYIMKYMDCIGIERTCKHWSNFNKGTYKEYQTSIRVHCNNNNEIPFIAEFTYWMKGSKII